MTVANHLPILVFNEGEGKRGRLLFEKSKNSQFVQVVEIIQNIRKLCWLTS